MRSEWLLTITTGRRSYVVTLDGTVITTNTAFYNDHPVFQHISTRTPEGKVKDIDVFNGKILP